MLYKCKADVLQIFYDFYHIDLHNWALVSRRAAVSDDSLKLWLHHTSSKISPCQRRIFHWTIKVEFGTFH